MNILIIVGFLSLCNVEGAVRSYSVSPGLHVSPSPAARYLLSSIQLRKTIDYVWSYFFCFAVNTMWNFPGPLKNGIDGCSGTVRIKQNDIDSSLHVFWRCWKVLVCARQYQHFWHHTQPIIKLAIKLH